MPDTNQEFNINIRTNADLTGLKEAQKQLKQHLKEIEGQVETYEQRQSRIEVMEGTYDDAGRLPPLPDLPPAIPIALKDPTAQFNLINLLKAMREGPMGFLKFLTNPAEKNPPYPHALPPETNAPPPPAPEAFMRSLPNGEGHMPAPFATNNPPHHHQDSVFIQEDQPPVIEPAFPNLPPAKAEANSTPDFASAADSHSQAIKFSGDRLRSALETNSQYTVSLFDQMLDWINGQNRKLDEISHKISQLDGQVKSLKNP